MTYFTTFATATAACVLFSMPHTLVHGADCTGPELASLGALATSPNVQECTEKGNLQMGEILQGKLTLNPAEVCIESCRRLISQDLANTNFPDCKVGPIDSLSGFVSGKIAEYHSICPAQQEPPAVDEKEPEQQHNDVDTPNNPPQQQQPHDVDTPQRNPKAPTDPCKTTADPCRPTPSVTKPTTKKSDPVKKPNLNKKENDIKKPIQQKTKKNAATTSIQMNIAVLSVTLMAACAGLML